MKLAQIVSWELAEQIYADAFREDFGAPSLSARVVLGALLIKEREGLTDRGTVATIQENPYMQYFIGLEEFTAEPASDASLMVDFRKRFGEAGLARISEAIALAQMAAKPHKEAHGSSGEDTSNDKDSPTGSSSTLDSDVDAVDDKMACTDSANTNHGKLIIDATCGPADIRYPTDVSLLNEAREKTDEIIDTLHHPLVGKSRRPRTYGQRLFLSRQQPRMGGIPHHLTKTSPQDRPFRQRDSIKCPVRDASVSN
ncbi:MAG: transposase [Planctomycetaceae bacterium]|nr:transposase [Planctomycetaceae bacterium]